MPQFDLLFFGITSFFIFVICIYLFFGIFSHIIVNLFKIKFFPKFYRSQKGIILSIKTEISIICVMRISWIKVKLLEFYDN